MNNLFRRGLFRRNFVVLVVVALVLLNYPVTRAVQPGTVAYRHAYYLFLNGAGTGCEGCYVPLLITQNPLEKIAAEGRGEEGVLIITYERDSIWANRGTVSLNAGDIEAAPRIVRLKVNQYRYQEISPAEALKLLENPLGSIPISRPVLQGLGMEKAIREELIRAFKSLQ